MPWFKIHETISDNCNLYYLSKCSDNNDLNNITFGISFFCTKNMKQYIEAILPRQILAEGFGSDSAVIKFTNGRII